MKIKVNKFCFDKFIFWLMLYYVLFGLWIGFMTNMIEYIICVCCVVSIIITVCRKNNRYQLKRIWIALVLLCIYVSMNAFMSELHVYVFDNIIYIMKCTTIIVYYGTMLSCYSEEIEVFLIKISPFLNFYMAINTLIMFLQLNESYFLIDKSRLPSVVYYPDYIDGLFGINGTHRLTLFSIFILCWDLYMYKFKSIKNYKILRPLIIIESVLLLFLSTQNDNNSFIIIYPLFLGITYICLYDVNMNRIMKIVLGIIAGIIVLSIVVMNNRMLFQDISERLGQIFSVYILRDVKVWDERKEFLSLSFSQGNGYLFGKGLGSVKMYSDIRFGKHWGMNSLMTFVYFFGIGPLILYLWAYFTIAFNSIHIIKDKESKLMKICFFACLYFLVQYCQLLSEVYLMVLYGMIVCVLTFAIKSKHKYSLFMAYRE